MDDQKKKKTLMNYGKKESDFLRLKRVRLGVNDFTTLKVIGKGAFGEVRLLLIKYRFGLFRRLTLGKYMP
jgi:protein-serine/threonine kinase